MSGSRSRSGAWRITAYALAVAFVVLAALAPAAWFEPAKLKAELAAPSFAGVALLRGCFVLNALLLAIAAWWSGRSLTAAPARETDRRLPTSPAPAAEVPADAQDIAPRAALGWLATITALAVALRLYGLDSGLWLDEISPITDYGQLSALQVIATYLGSNNHLLNTLLVNEVVAVFGPQAWAIRLPAAIFGMATIPALYWMSRFALSRRASLAAAALLATSYHHVFFSQNARGYSAYLCLSILACGLLVLALRRDRLRDWAGYAGIAALNVVALLNGAFVLAAHGLVGLVVALVAWRRLGSAALLRRVIGVHAVIGLLVLQVYVLVIPQIVGVMNTTYKTASAGFPSPFSAEFIRDLVGGLSPALAISASVFGLTGLVVGSLGLWRVYRGSGILAAALVLPNALLMGFVLVAEVAVTPRLFLFALVPAVVCLAAAMEWVVSTVALRWRPSLAPAAFAAAAGGVVLLSAASLGFYYATPKQDYGGAIDYLALQRQESDVVIVSYLAKYGYDFYAQQRGVPLDAQTYYARDARTFEAIVAANPERRIWVVSTFERALRLDHPAIVRSLQTDWVIATRLAGTIGDGSILVYRSKAR